MQRFARLQRALSLAGLACLLTVGCSRSHYRVQADHDAYGVIAERSFDPRWAADKTRIDMDPRSRYFDAYSADCPPMPQDDPLSQRYMKLVDGKAGWKHWYDNGFRAELENPHWGQALDDYVELSEDGSIRLDLDTALRLAYVHSPDHQRQLETLYLSALDVSGERFRLDTQFFAGYDAVFDHAGSLIPATLIFNPASGNYEIAPAIDGIESNRLTVGKSPAIELQRRFATAGQLLVGFANSFVFEFTGGDANLSSSLANFTFIQPLLRGAGRDIALEQLTFEERKLLANLRAYGQFRQGFYTQVAIGELGVAGPQRNGQSTNLVVSPAPLFVGGYAGLLQQLQQIRNSEDNLNLQLRTLAQLEALLAVGIIDLVQVDQFRQNVENERTVLLRSQNDLERALDTFKTSTLGLPPDLRVDLDDSLIQQFRLVSEEATGIQDSIIREQTELGEALEQTPSLPLAVARGITDRVAELIEPINQFHAQIQSDLKRMEDSVPTREQWMTEAEREAFRSDREQLHTTSLDLYENFRESEAELIQFSEALNEESRLATGRAFVPWLSSLLRDFQRAVLVQARARLESVTVERLDLQPTFAFQTAKANRFDLMNGRAALVDSWRLMQVRADALQSVLNVTADGDIRTARNNPLSFRAPTGTLRMGLEFDAPITRVLERNDYRESLISYQRSRRDLIQSQDSIHLGIRALLRQINLLHTNLEIQRRAVAIAIRRVDLTRAQLYAPVQPPLPGQRTTQFGPTAAFDLLSSLRSLRDTQNSFLGVWLSHYAATMRLAREMGVMQLDSNGNWSPPELPDLAPDQDEAERSDASELPPTAPLAPEAFTDPTPNAERLPPPDLE